MRDLLKRLIDEVPKIIGCFTHHVLHVDDNALTIAFKMFKSGQLLLDDVLQVKLMLPMSSARSTLTLDLRREQLTVSVRKTGLVPSPSPQLPSKAPQYDVDMSGVDKDDRTLVASFVDRLYSLDAHGCAPCVDLERLDSEYVLYVTEQRQVNIEHLTVHIVDPVRHFMPSSTVFDFEENGTIVFRLARSTPGTKRKRGEY